MTDSAKKVAPTSRQAIEAESGTTTGPTTGEAIVLPFEAEGNFPYRQFLMPAGLLNLYGPPQVLEEAR